jgi:hypothetical protein
MASVGTIGCNGECVRTDALGCGTQCGHEWPVAIDSYFSVALRGKWKLLQWNPLSHCAKPT